MKITMITGSPHRDGSTAVLAGAFQKGAEAAGHQVARFDAAFLSVAPCRACEYCLSHDGECVQKDDMDRVKDALMACDAVVLATPVYYSGMSAQLKAVIDRFFAFDAGFRETPRASALLAVCGDDGGNAMDALLKHYDDISDFLNWSSAGNVLAFGCSTAIDVEESDFPEQAERLGSAIAIAQ